MKSELKNTGVISEKRRKEESSGRLGLKNTM